jgi:hypothetical protein
MKIAYFYLMKQMHILTKEEKNKVDEKETF